MAAAERVLNAAEAAAAEALQSREAGWEKIADATRRPLWETTRIHTFK
jgi:hypothetical protein